MSNSCVAIGTFDGIHKGHQGLIEKLLLVSRKKKLKSIIVALSRPVRHVSGILTDLQEKKELLSRFNADEIYILSVDEKLVKVSAREFLDKFLAKMLKAKHLVVGKNFAFGHNREGNISWLKKNCPKYRIGISVKSFNCSRGKVISSSRIRNLLHQGRVGSAGKLLGRLYNFSGIHIKGRGIGRKMGIPTLNLKVFQDKLLPLGVFLVLVRIKHKFYTGIANIGTRPTFFRHGKIVPEVNLLGFKGKLGKMTVGVFLLKHIRNERKFKDVNRLKKQIDNDLRKARHYFGFTF